MKKLILDRTRKSKLKVAFDHAIVSVQSPQISQLYNFALLQETNMEYKEFQQKVMEFASKEVLSYMQNRYAQSEMMQQPASGSQQRDSLTKKQSVDSSMESNANVLGKRDRSQ